MVGEQVVCHVKAHRTEIKNREHGRRPCISLTERMDLPQPRYEFGNVAR